MAMSRSRGGTSLTTSPPIQISPSVISSRPAIMRSVVDLPQPDGPDQHDELVIGDLQVDALHRLHAAVVVLDDLADRRLQPWSCRSLVVGG